MATEQALAQADSPAKKQKVSGFDVGKCPRFGLGKPVTAPGFVQLQVGVGGITAMETCPGYRGPLQDSYPGGECPPYLDGNGHPAVVAWEFGPCRGPGDTDRAAFHSWPCYSAYPQFKMPEVGQKVALLFDEGTKIAKWDFGTISHRLGCMVTIEFEDGWEKDPKAASNYYPYIDWACRTMALTPDELKEAHSAPQMLSPLPFNLMEA